MTGRGWPKNVKVDGLWNDFVVSGDGRGNKYVFKSLVLVKLKNL